MVGLWAKKSFQIRCCQGDLLRISRDDLHGGFPAQSTDPPLQNPDAGLSGVAGDEGPDGIVGELKLGLLQTVALALLGQQMLLGDLELLLIGIAGELNDLHPVQQRPGDSIGGIGGGDEEYLREIEGHLQEVVPECTVLLPVQHLQQSGGRIAVDIGGQLVDLIQQQQGVTAPRPADTIDDTAGHSAHIGLPVTPDLGLIVDTAQRDPGQLPAGSTGHRHSDGGLAHAGRAHQAEDLALELRRQLPDGQELQNALLHLLEAVVVGVQRLPGRRHIGALFGVLVPGQIQ